MGRLEGAGQLDRAGGQAQVRFQPVWDVAGAAGRGLVGLRVSLPPDRGG